MGDARGDALRGATVAIEVSSSAHLATQRRFVQKPGGPAREAFRVEPGEAAGAAGQHLGTLGVVSNDEERFPEANGFFLNWNLTPGQGHGYEFNFVLIGALISLMLSGPGAFSIDGRRARHAETQAYGRARLRAGKV